MPRFVVVYPIQNTHAREVIAATDKRIEDAVGLSPIDAGLRRKFRTLGFMVEEDTPAAARAFFAAVNALGLEGTDVFVRPVEDEDFPPHWTAAGDESLHMPARARETMALTIRRASAVLGNALHFGEKHKYHAVISETLEILAPGINVELDHGVYRLRDEKTGQPMTDEELGVTPEEKERTLHGLLGSPSVIAAYREGRTVLVPVYANGTLIRFDLVSVAQANPGLPDHIEDH